MGKIERWNRTMRDKITKYQKTYKTLRWIDAFDDLINNYNNTIHSRINLAPNNVTEKQAEELRRLDNKKKDMALEIINLFNVGDRVRILKKKNAFEHGSSTFSKKIYIVDQVDKLALIVKSEDGTKLNRRIKPYNVKLVNEVEKAPEKPNIIKHSAKQNKREVKFINKQKRVEAFDDVDENTGQVIIEEKLKPEAIKRKGNQYIKVDDKVKSWFNMPDGSKQWYNGVVQKVNPKSYIVLYEDNDLRRMAKDEVIPIEEEIKPKEVKTKPIEKEEFKPNDRVKAIFKNNGIETEYFGTVKKITRTGLILTEFDDSDKQYMRSTDLELVS